MIDTIKNKLVERDSLRRGVFSALLIIPAIIVGFFALRLTKGDQC